MFNLKVYLKLIINRIVFKINLKKKFFFFNTNFFKKISYSGLKSIKLDYSFLFFFFKKFLIFNTVFYFNFFFLNYLFKLITVLKLLLFNKSNFLILMGFRKKNNFKIKFFRNCFFLGKFSIIGFSIKKIFNSYKYVLNWFYKNSYLFLPKYENYDVIIVYNFDYNLDMVRDNNVFLINFNYFLKEEYSDYPIYYNNFFFFHYFIKFFKKIIINLITYFIIIFLINWFVNFYFFWKK